MKAKRLESIKFVIVLIFVFAITYYSQFILKNYYGTKLSVLCLSLENILTNPSTSQKDLIIQNALPVINLYKDKFLKYPGYWLDIYNVYNEAAMVENLNGDKKAALGLLLVSIKYHPYLAETYRAISYHLKNYGHNKAAKSCYQFYEQLLAPGPVDLHLKQECLHAVKELL